MCLVNYIEQTWLPRHNGSLTAFSAMPVLTTTLVQSLLLLWVSFFRWGTAVPLKRADDCPGYTARNVVRSDNSITADLTLAGAACNLYSPDLVDLKFLAEWQTGTLACLYFTACS
jgi:alpha-glucosidase